MICVPPERGVVPDSEKRNFALKAVIKKRSFLDWGQNHHLGTPESGVVPGSEKTNLVVKGVFKTVIVLGFFLSGPPLLPPVYSVVSNRTSFCDFFPAHPSTLQYTL